MNDFVTAIVVAIVAIAVFSRSLERYSTRERSLLVASLAAHLVSGAALVLLIKTVFKGGDILNFDDVGRAMLTRFFRAPEDTTRLLIGLLLHSGDALPVPDYGLAFGSSGSMIALTTVTLFLTGGSLYGACVLVAALSFYGKLCIY